MKSHPNFFRITLLPILLLLNLLGTAHAAAYVSPSSQTVTATVNKAMNTATYTVSGFAGTVSYSLPVTPALPGGLKFSNSTGVISGTPTLAQPATTYTVYATDGKSTVKVSIKLTVLATLSPSSQSLTGTVNQQLQPSAAYTATGYTKTVTYSISPSLPTGLALNSGSGVISGKPIAALATTQYTVTATDGSNPAKATVKLTVNVPSATISPSTKSITGMRDQSITPLDYTTSNFGGTVTYTINPALPQGLVMNANNTGNGTISGTPVLPQLATTYTVTATGSTSGKATAQVTITIADACPTETLDAVGEGRRAYLRLNCYSCHGDAGLGGMGPKIIGQDNVGERVTIGSDHGMPAYQGYLCGNDINNLNAYLTNLETKSQPVPVFLHWWEPNPQDTGASGTGAH